MPVLLYPAAGYGRHHACSPGKYPLGMSPDGRSGTFCTFLLELGYPHFLLGEPKLGIQNWDILTFLVPDGFLHPNLRSPKGSGKSARKSGKCRKVQKRHHRDKHKRHFWSRNVTLWGNPEEVRKGLGESKSKQQECQERQELHFQHFPHFLPF